MQHWDDDAVWVAVQTHSKDPDFGLHFGEHAYRLLRRHLLYAMMMNCDTVEQAIQKNFQYHNLMMDIIRPVIRFDTTRRSQSLI
jgi:hypothetical protein